MKQKFNQKEDNMKLKSLSKNLTVMITASLILLAGWQNAFALGTPANTSVSSTATVSYDVGGLGQPAVTSTGGSFLVDRRIMLTVAEVGASYTDVTPSAIEQALKFTVTNNTNDVVDFKLTYTQDTTGTADPFGGTDDFNTTNIKFYQDANGNGTFEVAADTLITFVDEVAMDGVKTIFVVSDIPVGQPNGDTSFGTLTATAAIGGGVGVEGAAYTESTGADDPALVQTVFGDAAGDADLARDGKHSDDDGYKIVSATISVTKTITVISDPFNGTSTPKAIPGATIEYCIQVSNAGSVAAAPVTIADPIPVNSTFIAGSIIAGGTLSGGVCTGGTAEDDDSVGADDVLGASENTGNFNSVTKKVTTIIFSLATGGATTTTRFRVTVD